jgi:hypothetical protein
MTVLCDPEAVICRIFSCIHCGMVIIEKVDQFESIVSRNDLQKEEKQPKKILLEYLYKKNSQKHQRT